LFEIHIDRSSFSCWF